MLILIFHTAIRQDALVQSANIIYYSALLKTVIFTHCMFSTAAPHFGLTPYVYRFAVACMGCFDPS